MNDFSSFHFLRPWWLLLLFVPAILCWWQLKRGLSPWQKIVDPHLQSVVLVSFGQKAGRIQVFLLPIFIFLLSIAMAGPTINKLPDSSELLKKPLLILLELSAPMLSTDISPTRLKRAIYKIEDLLHEEPGREVSLIAFAGDAHVVVPFTSDHATVDVLLKSLNPSLMPLPGVNLLAALKEARESEIDASKVDILLVTSSNIDNEALEIYNYIKENHLHVSMWIFATESGAPLLNLSGQFVKDKSGSIVISRLNETWLKNKNQNFVEHLLMTPDNADVHALKKSFDSLDAFYRGVEKESYDRWFDLGPFFLILAMILFMVASLFLGPRWWLFAALFLLPIHEAKASGLKDWFKRADQRAYEALLSNEPKKAAELFQDDFGKGAAFYKAKEYEKALEHFSKVKTSDGFYNAGNAHAQLGHIDEGIKAYEEALKLNPQNNDARTNKELLEKLKQEKKDQQNQQQKDQQENKEDSKQNEEKDKQEQNKQSPEDQKNQHDQSKEEKKPESKEEKEQSQKKPDEENKSDQQEQGQDQARAKSDERREHHLQDVEVHTDHYLQRKFLYESRKKQGISQ